MTSPTVAGIPGLIASSRVRRPAAVLALACLVLPGAAATAGAASTAWRAPMPQIETFGASALTVTGGGEVTVPAETAEVQILLSVEPSGFAMSGFEERGAAGGNSISGSERAAPPERRRGSRDDGARGTGDAATPVAGEDALSEDRLAPIIAVLETAGIDPETVEPRLSPLATEPYGRPSGSARLDVVVADPTPDGLAALARSVSDAAAAEGLVVEMFAVGYRVADCTALEARAQQAAVADARARAERLAGALGVGIGAPVGAFDYGSQRVFRKGGGRVA